MTDKSAKEQHDKDLNSFDDMLKQSNEEIVKSIREDEELSTVVASFLNRKTCGCPFCGNDPARDLSRTGTSLVEAKALRESPEYQEDKQYRQAVEDLLSKDGLVMSYRLMCRNKDCLFPNTGFVDSTDAVFSKWERRAG